MEFISAAVVMVGISIILASSFNLILGFGGLLSIAHPIFFAIGAYTSALISMNFAIPIPLTMVAGIFAAAFASLVLSIPSLRVSGDYLVISSIGFQLGVLQIIKNVEWTGGAGGLTAIPSALESYSPMNLILYWIIVMGCACIVVGLVRLLTRGGYGRAIAAMRDDEKVFVSLGRNATKIKVTIFAVGAGMAGLAGGLYAHYFVYLVPEQFDIGLSSVILTMVIVGGVRSVIGPVVGALLLEISPKFINMVDLPNSILGPLQGIIFTSVVLLFLFLRPQGIINAAKTQSFSGIGKFWS
jgi:branched-chain amino acid transport system permease protein